jgi:hypothetical protein
MGMNENTMGSSANAAVSSKNRRTTFVKPKDPAKGIEFFIQTGKILIRQ